MGTRPQLCTVRRNAPIVCGVLQSPRRGTGQPGLIQRFLLVKRPGPSHATTSLTTSRLLVDEHRVSALASTGRIKAGYLRTMNISIAVCHHLSPRWSCISTAELGGARVILTTLIYFNEPTEAPLRRVGDPRSLPPRCELPFRPLRKACGRHHAARSVHFPDAD